MVHNSDDQASPEQAARVFPFLKEKASSIIGAHLMVCRVLKGEHLFTVGDNADCLYFVVKGQLAVKKETGFGRNSQVIALLSPNAPVGEAALTELGKHKTSVYAIEDSILLRLENKAFEFLKAEHPDIAVSLLQYLLSITCLRLDKCSERMAHIL